MLIRAARKEDLEAILPMVAKTCRMHEAMAPLKYPFLPDPASRYGWWLARLIEDKANVFLVAEEEGGTIGFVVATIEDEIPIYRVKRYGFVQELWVEEPYRRQGVARRLMDEVAVKFRAMGVEQLRLDVLVGNRPARQLFETLGFKEGVVEMILPL